MARDLIEAAVRRVLEVWPTATARRSGDVVRVDKAGHTAYVTADTVLELDDMDLAYLLEGLMYGRRS